MKSLFRIIERPDMVARLPLEQLRTFVHVAHLMSFRKAAEKLNLSVGALSQRIASLEEYLGGPLFIRHPQGIELLPSGKELLHKVAVPLELIEEAVAKKSSKYTLCIHTASSFAYHWLIPNLGEFRDRHPDINVEVSTGVRLVDITSGGIFADLAIRYGKGSYPNLHSIEILRPSLNLVASPEVLNTPDDPCINELLRTLPLLSSRDREEWDIWFDRFTVNNKDASWGMVLDDDMAVISAVVGKQGLGSVRDIYAKDLAAKGKLAILSEYKNPDKAFYLVGRQDRLERRDARTFLNWLKSKFDPVVGK
ncbi:LysR substrate-binding domain-containing protein [Phyllobacterium phragmitis]|uniref:LysR substrate-binding domain-containing protein n=1 Tax=Phyllobacterium phragmitis TaxID=2670329 RepID=UPI001304E72B|nr:LysR substrate-binding domain-containing protein [Phyllobacterium phragmitis]